MLDSLELGGFNKSGAKELHFLFVHATFFFKCGLGTVLAKFGNNIGREQHNENV